MNTWWHRFQRILRDFSRCYWAFTDSSPSSRRNDVSTPNNSQTLVFLHFRNGRFSNMLHSTIPTFVYDRYVLYALHDFTDSVPTVVATTGLKAVSSQLQLLKRNRGYQKMMTRILGIERFNPLSALVPTPYFDRKLDGGILDIPVPMSLIAISSSNSAARITACAAFIWNDTPRG